MHLFVSNDQEPHRLGPEVVKMRSITVEVAFLESQLDREAVCQVVVARLPTCLVKTLHI
jgi:hypothetical protein